ncbi:hypothetical protein DYB32_003290 [Aphanomyces invadans]|uniref:Uncharacterized protein n=1 Tax=Aphanomyces invadans TaxID=157072 RepID=A0A418B126_9STRA|nr:hypothetical protein DYB32_003290 [Aphanomyces invadans]
MERGSKAPPLYRPARSSNYNFVHVPQSKSPRRHHDPALPTSTLDTIVATILETWAVRLGQCQDDDSTQDASSDCSTVPERVRKLWQAVVRDAQTGVYGRASDDVVGQHALPNPICTAICVEIVIEVMMSHRQAPVYGYLDSPTQLSVAIELVKPLVTTEILGDLWESLMAKLPRRDHSQAAAHMLLFSRCFASLPRDEKREILPLLASSIQRRIEEFVPSIGTLESSSRAVNVDQEDSFDPDGVVPRSWEPSTFYDAATHHRPRGSVARASMLKSHTAPMDYRKTSMLGKPAHERGTRNGLNSLVMGASDQATPLPTMRKPSNARKGTMLGMGSSCRRKSTRIHDVAVLRPDQLHGILPHVGPSRQSTAPPALVKQPSSVGTGEPDTSAELLEFVDELADDLKDIYALLRAGEYRSQQSGMQDFAKLLTTRLHVSLDDVDHEHQKGGAVDPKETELMAVTSIIQLVKAHPGALGSVLKQVPDLVVDTLRSQQGILKYCMVHCSWVVRHFLKLDAAATETWQSIVKAQSKGLTLLWSTDQFAADEVVVSPIEAAYQWLQTHVPDAAKVLLLNHDLAKLIFAEMEREVLTAKATNKGLRLKMLLTELEDLPTFQAHMHLAAQKGLDMAIKHDMKGVVTMLTIILNNNAHLKDLAASSVEITAALAVHNKHALLNLLNSDVVTWKPFFVQIMMENNFLLTD